MSVDVVEARIVRACARSGRNREDVRLVAVTKGHDAAEVRTRIVASGVHDLGENRVQEWRDKSDALGDGITWHFIGNLQTNKVKYLAAGRVPWVHSVNSARLAEALSDRAGRVGHRFRILVEVDVADEEAKQGVPIADLDALVSACRSLPHVDLVGLMAMAPWSDSPETSRPYFRELVRLADTYDLPERSIGMSGDFDVAIEEGATIVRVGSALFAP